MGRWLIGLIALALGGATIAWATIPSVSEVRKPIRIGLLHSLTGSMAISEKSMKDAEVMAIEELNANGGLLGRKVEYVVGDGKSEGLEFAREAERLITVEKVSVLVGCWASSCRKSVKPVVERAKHLLIYPQSYEGLELSPRIIYTGGAPNQLIIPTVKWCRDTLKTRRFYLIGTDGIWPYSANAIIKDELKALGVELAGESYVAINTNNLDAAVAAIVRAKPDVILSTIEGEANVPFYKALRGAQGTKITAVTFGMTEDEFRQFPVNQMTNDYAVCNYFQAVDRPENQAFVRRFKARFGQDRVTCDAIATAYSSINLWAQAVREAESAEIEEVRTYMLRQSLDAPEGVISIDRESQHTWRPFFVGKIRPDGQVDIVQTLSKPIRPVPFPFSRTRGEWLLFLDTLYKSWGGNWSAPASHVPEPPRT